MGRRRKGIKVKEGIGVGRKELGNGRKSLYVDI